MGDAGREGQLSESISLLINLTYRKQNARSEFAQGFNKFIDATHDGLVGKVSTASSSLAAAEQQSHVDADLSKNLAQISGLAQGASSNAAQSSQATEDVSRLAHDLNEAVNRFVV